MELEARKPMRKFSILTVVAAAALLSLVLAVRPSSTPHVSAAGNHPEKPGDDGTQMVIRLASNPQPMPPFLLSDLNGQVVSTAAWRGKVVLLNFWATWCPPCREEIPALDALARELGPKGLTVLGVNFKESRPQIDAFVRERRLGFPMLLDADGLVSERYQVFALPVSVLVDRRGMLVGT